LFGVQSKNRSGKARPPTKDLFHNNSYAHYDQGDNPGQVIAGMMVSSKIVTVTSILISNVKMSAAPTWFKQKDVTCLWPHCTSVRRGQRCISAGGLSLHKYQPGAAQLVSTGPVAHAYLTHFSCMLCTLCTHQSIPLLSPWASALGLLTAYALESRVGWTPARKEQTNERTNERVILLKGK